MSGYSFQGHFKPLKLSYLTKSPFFKCSIRLTTYDMVKRLIATSQKEFQRIVEENRNKQQQKVVG